MYFLSRCYNRDDFFIVKVENGKEYRAHLDRFQLKYRQIDEQTFNFILAISKYVIDEGRTCTTKIERKLYILK
jgi:hypothetical protein